MKRALIICCLFMIVGSLKAQQIPSDTIINKRVYYDTVIVKKVVKRTVIDTTFVYAEEEKEMPKEELVEVPETPTTPEVSIDEPSIEESTTEDPSVKVEEAIEELVETPAEPSLPEEILNPAPKPEELVVEAPIENRKLTKAEKRAVRKAAKAKLETPAEPEIEEVVTEEINTVVEEETEEVNTNVEEITEEAKLETPVAPKVEEVIEEVVEETNTAVEETVEDVAKLETPEEPKVEEAVEELAEEATEETNSTAEVIPERPSLKSMESYQFPSELGPLNKIDDASKYAAMIKKEELEAHLRVIASDEFEGRETGALGQKQAAQYIANKFESYGIPSLKPTKSYMQEVPLYTEEWERISISVNDKEYKFMKDFYSFPKSNQDKPLTERNEVIFMGYGVDDENYSDYEGVDVQGKVIIIYQGEPMSKDSIYYVSNSKEPSEWSNSWELKLKTARKRGVRTVLFIEKNIPFYVNRYRYYLSEPYIHLAGEDEGKMYANSCYISTDIAKEIIGEKFDKIVKARNKINSSGKPQNVELNAEIVIRQKELKKEVFGENVLGYIEGSDPELKEELLVISAHYDHLGKRGDDIFNGADDNGSGTSALLEIAQSFAQAKKDGKGPKRSILILLVSGEEKGLLGSEYYASNPSFPLEKTIANLNVDMIGRTDPYHEGMPNYIYVIGADRLSTDLHNINEEMNQKYTALNLDYTYNAEDDPNQFYYRSDHYNFAEKGIPAAFFFSGTHKDYHRPSDTADKILYDKVERISQLVFLTAWELSNRDERIKVDKAHK